MPAPENDPAAQQIARRRSRDDVLLADLTAPPSVEDARDSLEYWQHRQAGLPIHRRAERRAAQEMVTRWQQRFAAAERELHGPGPVEQLLELLGIRWRPDPRRLLAGLGLAAALLMIVAVAVVVAIVVFWPQLEPIVRTLLNSGQGEGG